MPALKAVKSIHFIRVLISEPLSSVNDTLVYEMALNTLSYTQCDQTFTHHHFCAVFPHTPKLTVKIQLSAHS